MTARHLRPAALALASRLLAIVPGGYAFSAAWVAAMGGLLGQAGLRRVDAVALSAMLGFVFYLVFIVWGFAQQRLARLWTVTLAGTALCLALVQWLNLGR